MVVLSEINFKVGTKVFIPHLFRPTFLSTESWTSEPIHSLITLFPQDLQSNWVIGSCDFGRLSPSDVFKFP